MTEEQMEGQMSIFDLDIWSGKTYPEHSAPTKEKISEPSLKKPRKWQKGMPAYLDLRGGAGHQQDASWEMGGALLGEYTMHSFGESPNAVRESRLSQILEAAPHPKYCLSAKACLGILRRAEKRGKVLPPMLDQALRRQAGLSVFKNEPESQGGGKGILIRNEHVGCLSTLNNQSVCAFEPGAASRVGGHVYEDDVAGTVRANAGDNQQAVVYGISAYDSNAMKSDNPNSGIYKAETARTLDLNGGSPACNQGGMAVVCATTEMTPKTDEDGVSFSLRSRDYKDPQIVCLEGNGSRPSHKGDGYAESDTMYTLNSTEHHAVAYGIDQQGGKGGAAYTVDVAPTMASDSHGTPHAVCIENHPADSRVKVSEDGIVQTLSSRMGTGGGNVPMVMESINGEISGTLDASYYKGCGERQGVEREVVCVGNGQLAQARISDKVGALNCMHDQQAVITYGLDRASFNQGINAQYDFAVDEEKIGTQVAKGPGAVCQSVVRRLTPMECERLQGFPDHWTDIGEWTDSKGKKHKDADSPRYKALGNSIALPFWSWMAERMVAYLGEEPTMASLFDGIGGFPLVFSSCGCTPVWASEIEEFPIAVTKIRFPN